MVGNVRWRGQDGQTGRRDSGSSSSSSSSSSSRTKYSETQGSNKTYSTAPTERSIRPELPRLETCYARIEGLADDQGRQSVYEKVADSFETYSSTIVSEDDLSELEDESSFDVMDLPEEEYHSEAIPTTPREFSELFPSPRRISIRHDDTTSDGNMNLRLDTQVESKNGKKQSLTLFHLRMHDLRSRNFSLRRYCRDSGREVCHSVRKYHQSSRPRGSSFQRSITSALAGLQRTNSGNQPAGVVTGLKRSDSGYGSVITEEEFFDEPAPIRRQLRKPTNTTKLEFSNYAHVEVKRRTTGSGKRYDFEYWGFNYSWKRNVRKEGSFDEVSYHLVRSDRPEPLAHIVPVPLTRAQAEDERLKGGWVPPCSLWISNNDVINGNADIADVVVATALIALVDDSIKRKWHSKRSRPLLLPRAMTAPFRMNFEYVGPKRLMDEVFNRAVRQEKNLNATQSATTRVV